MTGHSGFKHTISGVQYESINTVDQYAWMPLQCPHCETKVNGAVIAYIAEQSASHVTFIRCTNCQKGIVKNGAEYAPSPLLGESVEGLPADTNTAYLEARKSASSGAYTSCELMCRKILMHVAVEEGAKEGQSFASYLKHLESQGYVTPPMKPWVDLIRQRGNIATHEIPATTQGEATRTLEITTQLLKIVYEMTYKASMYGPTQDAHDGFEC